LFFIGFFKKNIIFEIHKIHRYLDISIAKKVKKIIVVTRGLKKDLIKNNIKENKILVASDGIDLDDFKIKESEQECRKKLNLPLDKKLVLYTGHLYSWKGVETLALASKYVNGLVVIVGGIKWYLTNFKKFVKRNKLDVLVLGYKDYSLIPFYLKSSDCLVLCGTKRSTVSKKYTSPMKMFEYMASKKPIVASDLESFKEVLNNKNSILVESDNEKALADGINKVLGDRDLAQKLSSQAYLDVQKYTWDDRAKQILDFVI
ncbi:MAG: glycosyltransferase family 4 protein, partial [Patescibacteria group bacterium]